MKALGIGIGFNLQRIDFHIYSEISENLITQDTQVLIDGELQADWLFQETMLDGRHCVAVALQNVSVNFFFVIKWWGLEIFISDVILE